MYIYKVKHKDMITLEENLFIATTKEIRNLNASDFNNGSIIYVKPKEESEYKYIITLEKGSYKSFSLKSTVECADTYKYLTTPGTSKGMRPYFINDFLDR